MNKKIIPAKIVNIEYLAIPAKIGGETNNKTIPAVNYSDFIIPKVDRWRMTEDDKLFKTNKGYIYTNIGKLFGIEDQNNEINVFHMKSKRSYNSDVLRDHNVLYLNYFFKYFDTDKVTYSNMVLMKTVLEKYGAQYSKDSLISDIKNYMLDFNTLYKIRKMNDYNYYLELSYTNTKNPVLEYQNKHAKILMEISLLMNLLIPILSHYMYKNDITNTSEFLLEIYDVIFELYDSDIITKLYETSYTNVAKNAETHKILWDIQDIRGNNVVTHSLNCVSNIILNIIPKYVYDSNLIKLNSSAIQNNTGYQITDISYEFSFVSLSSSKRDEDNNNEIDRYESRISKIDESSSILNQVISDDAVKQILESVGYISDEEFKFYRDKLFVDRTTPINNLQLKLIGYLFYKNFGDPSAINYINKDSFVRLLIAAKRKLEANGLIILPYIVSSEVVRVVTRKNINKKELTKLSMSPYYDIIMNKYKSEKIEKEILSMIAIILSSEFKFISYNNPELNGITIDCIPEIICEEILLYISLI